MYSKQDHASHCIRFVGSCLGRSGCISSFGSSSCLLAIGITSSSCGAFVFNAASRLLALSSSDVVQSLVWLTCCRLLSNVPVERFCECINRSVAGPTIAAQVDVGGRRQGAHIGLHLLDLKAAGGSVDDGRSIRLLILGYHWNKIQTFWRHRRHWHINRPRIRAVCMPVTFLGGDLHGDIEQLQRTH
ncbi:hypothetical protein EJ06DRAFT_81365 [Trichodelitschia bisporula]|uniref:Uncharacterized protein n=1 Tax=Trichodelitschia bisporula TaxID=703511 RepID=A0A6G1HU19_9PEZI|nr:hypothetical protein EJ06DRAFT_81365 [Trichodelitschia bisporula]